MKRIGTQNELDNILRKADGTPLEFYVLLKGGLRSSKNINFDEDENYEVQNEIDGSEEVIEHDKLMQSFPIGKAIAQGAFFQWQF